MQRGFEKAGAYPVFLRWQLPREAARSRAERSPRPLAFALAAGLVRAFAWYLTVRFTNFKLGLVAVGVGWLVGRGALFGSQGRGSTEIAIGSVVVALGAMLFGEYLILDHFARQGE